MLKKLICLALAFSLLSLGIALTARKLLIIKADAKAEELLGDTTKSSDQDAAIEATKNLYAKFQKGGAKRHKLLARLRPYIANERLPDFIRAPKGAVALATMEGWCDDAARALIYTLAKRNIASNQWNMQGRKNAHAAVIADFGNGHTALLDPYYGYHSITPHGPVSPQEAGKKNALIPMDENSNRDFYSRYDKRFMGIQGEPLTISIHLPDTKKPIALGEADGKNDDLRRDLGKRGMTITWEYVGHKYDRGWTRELIAPTPMKVEIILTSPANENVLRTFSPQPAIDGTKLTWDLLKDEKIVSEDGKAGISWTRLNSYIDIDQIILTPEGDTP